MNSDSHIASHPAFPIIHRVTTQGRMLGADLKQLNELGYDIDGALATLGDTNRDSVWDAAAKGNLNEHHLLTGLSLTKTTPHP